MTTADVSQHWRKRARDSLTLARAAVEINDFADCLFHCHLAVEKCLKAEIMEKTQSPHPRIHSLAKLAAVLGNDWSADDQALFFFLSDFAVAARYDDPAWAQHTATAQTAQEWIERTEAFLSRMHV